MNLKAKPIIKGEYWVVTDGERKVGNVISNGTEFAVKLNNKVERFDSTKEIEKKTHIEFLKTIKTIEHKKTKQNKLLEGSPEYLLFKKIIRGDAGDNVFTAYPGVREKGSKNKIGIMEAFEDREKQGFNWNSFMLSRWVDHDGVEHRVRDCYERNKTLIDLKAQPQDIKDAVD